MKEVLISCLKNKTRRRRALKRFFNDLSILLNEAIYTDEMILNKSNQQARPNNTACMTITIQLVLNQQLQMILRGFELDLYRNEELSMIF